MKDFLLVAAMAATLTLSSSALPQDPCPPVKVFVLDADSGLPVSGATVVDIGSGEALVTDDDGIGTFAGATGSDGAFTFKLTAQGYPWNYRKYEFGGASTTGGATGYSCTAEASRIATLYLDAAGEMLSAPIGAAGGNVQFRKVTGASVSGQDFIQSVSVTIPPGTWNGRYRIALSLPVPEAFTTAYLPESVSAGGITGTTRYPFAQVRIELQDMNGQSVDLGGWTMPMHVSLSSARGDAKFVGTQIESVQRFDDPSKTWGASGAQVTGFDPAKNAVDFDIPSAGTYSISPLLGLGTKVAENCFWKPMGSIPIICGGGASPMVTTRQVASNPCGVLFDDGPIQVDQTITKTVNSQTSVDLGFKVSDTMLSSGFKFHHSLLSSDTYTKKIKETRHLNPAIVEGQSGTATLFVSGRIYVWGLFCEDDMVPQAQAEYDIYSGTCWDISELTPCN